MRKEHCAAENEVQLPVAEKAGSKASFVSRFSGGGGSGWAGRNVFTLGGQNWSGQVSRAFGDIPFKKYGVLCLPELMKFKVKSASWMQIAYFSFNRLTHHEKLLVNALVN